MSSDGDAAGRVRLLPLGDADEVARVVAEVADGDLPALERHPAAGLPRRLTRAVTLPLLAAAAAFLAGQAWIGWAAIALALVMVPVALDRHRSLGHGVGRRLLVRSGSLRRRRSVLDPAAPVGYTVRTSPFQRRRGLASVTVHLGLGAGSRTVIDLGEDQAHALLTALQPWTREPGVRPAGPPG